MPLQYVRPLTASERQFLNMTWQKAHDCVLR